MNKEKIVKMKFCGLLCAAILAISLFLIPSHIWLPNPFKITNPIAVGFNYTHFMFSDYKNENQVVEILNSIFPKGSPRERLDLLFLNKLSMSYYSDSPNEQGLYTIYYAEPAWRKFGLITGQYVFATFDHNNQLSKKIVFGYVDRKESVVPIGVKMALGASRKTKSEQKIVKVNTQRSGE